MNKKNDKETRNERKKEKKSKYPQKHRIEVNKTWIVNYCADTIVAIGFTESVYMKTIIPESAFF